MRNENNFFRSKANKGSQFWKSLHKVKHLFKWGAIHQIGNGELTQFWKDVWLTSSPRRLCFPSLYSICNNTMISVAECADMGWQIGFRRMLGHEEMEEWKKL
jgi:hypothetical protein